MHHKVQLQANTSTKLSSMHQLVYKVISLSRHPILLESTTKRNKEINQQPSLLNHYFTTHTYYSTT